MNTTPQRIETTSFPGGKRIALTTSWDDGTVYDRWVVEGFNAWGLKGTFNLNSSRLQRTGVPQPTEAGGMLDASEVAALYAGHEVAIHTCTHPSLANISPAQAAYEVLEDQKALEDLVGYPVRGMAYPNGSYNARIIEMLRGLGIVYSRTVENADPCFPPREPLAWPATLHWQQQHPSLSERWETYYGSWWMTGVFFIWGHSYELATAGGPDALEAHFKPLSGKPDVWYCTNIELFDYEVARQRLIIAGNLRTVYNPSVQPVTINVDGTLMDVQGGQTIKF